MNVSRRELYALGEEEEEEEGLYLGGGGGVL